MTDEPKLKPCPWKVGDRVMRKPGASYMFPGGAIEYVRVEKGEKL